MNSHRERDALPRGLGLWSASAIVVGSIIGSGIFRSPAGIAARLPGPVPMLSVWVVAGLVALCGSLTLSELSTAMPRTGGVFVYIREAWGRLPAFLFGWSELVIIRAASLGAISTTFAEYLFRLLGYDPAISPNDAYVHYVAAAAIILTCTLNIVGLRWGAAMQIATSAAKFGGLVVIVMLAFALGLPRTGGHYAPAVPSGSFAAGAFGLALVSTLWAYDGWADLSFAAGEVRDPQRNMPRALLGGALAVMAIYLLANLAYLAVLPVEQIRTSRLVAADVAARLVGAPGVVFVAATVVISTFGTLNAVSLTSPRVFFAMADDGLFFRRVAAVHPRFKTPYVAIALAMLLGTVFVLLRTFEQLADTFVTAIIPFYALGVGAVFVLRRRAGYAPSFRTPGYPVVPALFILATLFLLGNALVDPTSRWGTLAVLAVIMAGVPVFYATVGRRGAEAGTRHEVRG